MLSDIVAPQETELSMIKTNGKNKIYLKSYVCYFNIPIQLINIFNICTHRYWNRAIFI